MNTRRLGFTIVELLVVIVVIGILAGVAIIGYGAWKDSVIEKQLKSDLTGAASSMESGRNFGSDYPSNLPASFSPSDGVTVNTKSGGGTFCIEASSVNKPDLIFNVKNGKQPALGKCDAYYTSIVAVGINTSCGIEYGKAYCWGEAGSSGSLLGNGNSGNSSVPVAVDTTVMKGKVTGLTSANGTVCAIADSKVYCWGNGTSGLLGNGSTAHTTVPVAVDRTRLNGTVTDISMGGMAACAIAGGKAYCWGNGTNGQLGNGTTVTNSPVPVPVATSVMKGAVKSISMGSTQVCAISDAKAYCWGIGAALGNGSTAVSSSPKPVDTSVMIGNVTAIYTQNTHTCAIASAKAYCWGSGSYSPTANGFLGNGSNGTTNVPVAVNTSVMSGNVTSMSLKGATACAIADDKAYCWGENVSGQLGNDTTTNSGVPVAVTTSTMSKKVSSITTGSQTCAVSEDELYCWGLGTSGQLGNGSSSNVSSPVKVDTSTMKGKVMAMSLGNQHTCAIADDRIYCWGNNSRGQLGIGGSPASNTPVMLVPNP